jgi:hypothetical protein
MPTRPGEHVVGQSPAGGTVAAVGAAVTLEMAVDRAGNGALGLTLVPEVLGLPGLLRQAGLHGQVTTAYDTDAGAAAMRPGLVWKAAPGPGGQTALARPVEPDSLWGRTVLVDHPPEHRRSTHPWSGWTCRRSPRRRQRGWRSGRTGREHDR